MRVRMVGTRRELVTALQRETDGNRFDFIGQPHRYVLKAQYRARAIERMREAFGMYLVGDSRINVAGFQAGSGR